MNKELGIKVMSRVTRGCGVRKAGGLYLFCGGGQMDCYRLPIPLPDACPCCGEELRQLRSVRMINPQKLWGDCKELNHPCHNRNCFVCFPPEKSGLMWVGKGYYSPEHFVMEAHQLGVSKRIPRIPKNLNVGDRMFFVHNESLPAKDEHGNDRENRAGVFFAATITEFHKIITEKQADDAEYINSLIEKGITPVLEVDEEIGEYVKTYEYDVPQKSILDFE